MIPKELQKLRKLEEQKDSVDNNLVNAKKRIADKIRKLNYHLQGDTKKFDDTMNKMVKELVGASYVIDLQNKEMRIIQQNEKTIASKCRNVFVRRSKTGHFHLPL